MSERMPTTTTTDFASDVPLSVATAAHAGTSHTPERRGAQVRDDYQRTLQGDLAQLQELADTDDRRALLADSWASYRSGYRTRTLAWLQARARCVSTMIAGPARFPVARQQRVGARADQLGTDLVDYRRRTLAAIARDLQPGSGPIRSGDPDAVAQLQQALADAQALQARMVADNATIRRHARAGADAQLAALVAGGCTDQQARLLLRPDDFGRIGWPDYRLRNNGAEVRRLQARLAQVQAAKATPTTTIDGAAAQVIDDPAANRVRLVFPDKPSREVRDQLHGAGWRWATTLGAWQQYRSPQALAFARQVAGCL